MNISKKRLSFLAAVIVVIVFSVPFLAYFLKISPLELFNQKWDKERLYTSLTLTREGFNESYNQIPQEEKKRINDLGELTVKEITEMTNSFISIAIKKEGIIQEPDRTKVKETIKSLVAKIKSFNNRYQTLFQTTVHRLETIGSHL